MMFERGAFCSVLIAFKYLSLTVRLRGNLEISILTLYSVLKRNVKLDLKCYSNTATAIFNAHQCHRLVKETAEVKRIELVSNRFLSLLLFLNDQVLYYCEFL